MEAEGICFICFGGRRLCVRAKLIAAMFALIREEVSKFVHAPYPNC
jgi:hypothetical protein